MKNNSYLRISLYAQLLLAVYFQLINWFSLGHWNYQPGFVPIVDSDKIEFGSIGLVSLFLLPFLVYLLAYRKHWILLLWIGTVGYSVWLIFQIQNWWIPYLFGASQHWHDVYYRVFAQSTKILPSFGNHLAPDAMHLTIQILLVVVVVYSVVGLIKLRQQKKTT